VLVWFDRQAGGRMDDMDRQQAGQAAGSWQ
jgi:hypothetical protein